MYKNKKRKEYVFSKYDGSYLSISSLPSYQEVSRLDLLNRPYVLIPDNNVCIHVSDSNIETQDKTKKTKAKKILKYIRSSNITVEPTWGLLERASKPGTFDLDRNKLKDFEDTFWRKLNHYSNNDLLSRSIDSIDFMKSVIYPMYMYLLKIKLILVQKEPNASNAKDNIIEMYKFMNEMQLFSAIIWQITIAIFGGDNLSIKLIKHKKNNVKSDIFKDLWGAAWDVYYLQLPHLFYGLRKIDNNYPQIIFATDDNPCAKIASFMKVIGNIDYGNIDNNQTLISFDFPYWKHRDSFLRKMSHEIRCEIIKRSIRRNSLSEIDSLNELESIIDNSSKQIDKLTQELKTLLNKGFNL